MAKEIAKDSITKRHLDFPGSIYKAAWQLMDEENARPGNAVEREYLKTFLPKLVGDGVSHRKGKVFSRAAPGRFVKDKEWLRRKAAAEIAVKEFMEYEDELLVP